MSFREGVAWATNQLGVLARLRGELDQALRLQQESLAEHRALGDRWRAASVLDELAAIAIARRDAVAAVQHLAAADRLRVEIHAPVPACERPDYEATVRLTRDGARIGVRRGHVDRRIGFARAETQHDRRRGSERLPDPVRIALALAAPAPVADALGEDRFQLLELGRASASLGSPAA